MAQAITARRKGDDYQSRFLWSQLLRLRTDDYVASVTFESDDVRYVDDIVVRYATPRLDPSCGEYFEVDYIQCKYHVTQSGAFSCDNLIDPAFINAKDSLLTRLYSAYQTAVSTGEKFRLRIISNWPFDIADPIAPFVSTEGELRPTLFEKPKGQVKAALTRCATHLGISIENLHNFLKTVRFELGKNLADLKTQLDLQLQLASLKPIDHSKTSVIYDDLAWKWFGQGKNVFDRDMFQRLLEDESLIHIPEPNYSEISICSCPQFARRPRDIQVAHLDACDLFDGRFPRNAGVWSAEIPERLTSFLFGDALRRLPQPIHLFFDCHLSMAFLAGYLVNPKFGLHIIPAQKLRNGDYTFWDKPIQDIRGVWQIKHSEPTRLPGATEAVIDIGITHSLESHLTPFLLASGLGQLPRITAIPLCGHGHAGVRDGEYAWSLGYELQSILRSALPATCETLHVFYAGPAALGYILGNTLRGVAPTLQFYEHDFEGRASSDRYYPSVLLSAGLIAGTAIALKDLYRVEPKP